MSTLIRFFLPDSLPENSTQRRRGRLTLLVTLVVIAACFVYSGAHYRWGFSEGILILWGGGGALFSVPILLKNEASPSFAAKCTAALMWLLLSLLMIRSGGIGSTSTPWLVVPPLIALLLAGQRFATVLAGVTVIEIIAIYGLELNGVSFPMPFSEAMLAESFFSSYVGLVVVIFLIARLFKNGQQQAMSKAHAAKEEARAQKEETEKMAERLR